MILVSFTKIMIQTSVHNSFLILVISITESVAFSSSTLFIAGDLVLNAAKLLKLVFWFRFVIYIRCSEIISRAFANIYLTVASSLRSADITAQETSTVSCAQHIWRWWHSILRRVLMRTLCFDRMHVARREKSFFVVAMRYSILVEVDAISRDIVGGTSWSSVRWQNRVAGFWIDNIGLPWQTDTEFGYIFLFAVR